MTEQLWRECDPEADPFHVGCRQLWVKPVAAGALLIPDGFDAAMERMIACDLDANGEASYEALLRAAVGEGDR